MPSTPDPAEVQTALLVDANEKLDKILSALSATTSPSTPTPAPTPEDDAAAFLAKWSPGTDEEFRARYGVDPGQKIPAMTTPDVAEAIYRARWGYSWQGGCYENADRRAAVVLIANATPATVNTLYEQGYGKCDPDFCAYGFLTGILTTKQEAQRMLGATWPPSNFKGFTIEFFLNGQAKFMAGGGGAPSGG